MSLLEDLTPSSTNSECLERSTGRGAWLQNVIIIDWLPLRLMFNDEEGWKAQRRYVLKTLKDFGFGKKGLEGVLLEEEVVAGAG